MANLSNINNKFLVTTGGNVLIGQTSAVGSSIFQVTGTSTFSGNVGIGIAAGSNRNLTVLSRIACVVSGTTANAAILFGDDDDDSQGQVRYNNSDDSMELRTNSTERIRISSNGTTKITTDGTEQLILHRSDSSIFLNNTIGTIKVTADDPTANVVGGQIQFTGGGTWSSNNYPTNIIFSNDNAGTLTERMRINSQGQMWLGGSFTGANIANGNTNYMNNLNAGSFSILHRNSSDVYVHFNSYYTSSNTYVSKYNGRGFMLGYNAAADTGFFFSKAPNTTAGQNQTFSQIMTVGYGTSNYVGIGTTAPTYGKLQIHTASAIGYTPTVFMSGTNIRLQTGGTAATNVTTGISMGVGGAAEAYIGAVQNVSTYADIVFQTYHGAYGERMRITSAGNVGIGTDSPGAYGPATGTVKLDVKSGDIIRSGFNTPAYNWIGFTSLPGYAANSYASITSKSTIHFANNDKYCAYLEGPDTYFGILNSAAQTKVFFATGTANSYLAGTGNFGVGITGPLAKLHVVGGTGMTGGWGRSIFLEDTYPAIVWGSNATKYAACAYDHSVDSMRWYTGAATSDATQSANLRMTLKAGNLGIGADSPAARLHVVSSTPDAAIFDTTSASYGAMNTFKAQGVTKGASGYNSGSMYFGGELGTNTIIQSGGQTGIYINNSTRNVGIATTLPGTYKLNVVGTALFSGAVEMAGGGAVYQGQKFWLDGGGDSYIESPSSNVMHFYTNGIQRARITDGGNFIIGTETSTACTLKVSSTKNGSESDPHFCLTGNGYTALHWLDTVAYYIMQNSTGRQIRIISNTGGVKLTVNATAWVSNSDIALKENLKPLENVLDKVKDYRCVEYNLKESPKDKKIGFIAQDWENDFPAIVDKDENDMLGIKYTETIPVLLKAIQELEARIKILENK